MALAGALLYVVAVLGLPVLHLGFHRADHDHRDGGIHYHGRLFEFAERQPGVHFHAPFHEHLGGEDVAPKAPPLTLSVFTGSFGNLRASQPVASDSRRWQTPYERHAPAEDSSSRHVAGGLAHFATAFLSSGSILDTLPVGPAPKQTAAHAPAERFPEQHLLPTRGARGPPHC